MPDLPDPPQPPSLPPPAPNGSSASRVAVLSALVVVVAGGTYWLSGQMGQSEQIGQAGEDYLPQDDTASKQNEEKAAEIIAKVREHILIADGTTPTVATIIDVEKLQAQNEFYLLAKNGNFLVITAKRAILYDEERDLVLDIASVRLEKNVE